MSNEYSHFDGAEALQHVLKTKVKGTSSEPHGLEIPGHLFAATDTARTLSLVVMLLWILAIPHTILALCSLGMLIGCCGRSAWISWARLERLHRNLEQEHYEIEHHRVQEREELRALYGQKGFQGPLLEQVVDVLMADEDRLLRVMLEEEMGFSLSSYEHPLKQCFGALIGGIITLALLGLTFFFIPSWGLVTVAFIITGISAGLSAHFEQNKVIPAVVWGLSIAALAVGLIYFSMQML